MSDKELLELAAKASGYTLEERYDIHGNYWPWCFEIANPWSPLTDDGDALRLAVKLGLVISFHNDKEWVLVIRGKVWIQDLCDDDPYAATRRAIVRAAAEIGGRYD